ncbi:entericidin A/B family lipoprotein [Halomonas sp. SSL-5]|nr:entericidin A/B family lipoprotein [Halomonas sp. SSL-5]MDY7117799.1 entericidin A/B family lipoprotein [Halomonas sp. SSL-5]
MKRSLTMLMATLFAVSLLAGCNTIRGAGQDIEQGGEAVQDAAS